MHVLACALEYKLVAQMCSQMNAFNEWLRLAMFLLLEYVVAVPLLLRMSELLNSLSFNDQRLVYSLLLRIGLFYFLVVFVLIVALDLFRFCFINFVVYRSG